MNDLDPRVSGTLRMISLAMGAGLTAFCAVVGVLYARSGAVATPEKVRLVNVLTGVSMFYAAVAIVVSEVLWKSILRRPGDLSGKARTGFIVRLALREGAALLGCVTALLAAMNGVLRAYPAYWVDLAPAALFWSFLVLHWPAPERLLAEIRELTIPIT